MYWIDVALTKPSGGYLSRSALPRLRGCNPRRVLWYLITVVLFGGQSCSRFIRNEDCWQHPSHDLSLHTENLVRIMLPNVWQITEILQTNASSYELYVEAEERAMDRMDG